ncbi:DUF5317 family protein [Dactylosporangium sp. AC04546]|uniref:DUF5317 family protein n=1 Tax=Dactylosporangium sp. AC04546 TaxID=2862460 RepID=UPI001EDE603F|nr:DUF5317 family protein [Dactylosporangium sp. AC04546]WVK85560.1 DUF5317 family protein [Dactylosporangium sp. AC04546]
MSIRMLVLVVIPPLLGVGIGYLAGGRLAGFRAIRIRGLWLLWLAAGLQVAHYYVPLVRELVSDRAMLAVVFAPVLLWLGVNLRHWPAGLRIAGAAIVLGAALNAVAIGLNGRMPYSPAAAEAAGLRAGITTPKNVPAGDGTRLSYLGDIIPIAPLRKVVSLGDLLISGGSCAVVALAMRRHRRESATVQETRTAIPVGGDL